MRETEVAVIGGGVVGCAVLYALARRGVVGTLLEAEPALALGASGTNSGILHTGFDSAPGELETQLIVRSAELRDEVLEALGVPVLRCGAVLRPGSDAEQATVFGLAENATRNGVAVTVGADGALEVPGEAVTDPVAYTLALAGAAVDAGAQVRTGARVDAITRDGDALVVHAGGASVRCAVAINCAGLFADDVARLAGDDDFAIRPRKGEFFVFDAPGGRALERIVLPVPTKRTKGVLVFPTLDGRVIAGPTAHDQDDKDDWTVRDDAAGEVLPKARAMLPALEGAEPVFRYAGLRPAGRDGVNYAIGASQRCPGLVHVAAIRSTGLSASLGIAEHVVGIVERLGVALGADRPLGPGPSPPVSGPWWQRTARHRGLA
jgi:glycerol-3-phosphate dehydrogenase